MQLILPNESISEAVEFIRTQYAKGGVIIDEVLERRIAIAARLATIDKAERAIASLAEKGWQWSNAAITETAQSARSGITDEVLKKRIDMAERYAHRQHAEDMLTKLEKIDVRQSLISISKIPDRLIEIRNSFRAAGTEINAGIEARMIDAMRHAYLHFAEAELENLGKGEFIASPRSGATSGHEEDIRHLFVLGGIQLTAEGKLPEPLETRLVENRHKAIAILRSRL